MKKTANIQTMFIPPLGSLSRFIGIRGIIAICLALCLATEATAQKMSKSEQQLSLLQVGEPFEYSVEQKGAETIIKMGKNTYRITTETVVLTSATRQTKRLRGSYKPLRKLDKRLHNDYLSADYICIVPGLGIVGWNESRLSKDREKGKVREYHGQIDWVLRPDGYQFEGRNNNAFIYRAGIHDNGITADRVFYAVHPHPLARDTKIADYPAKAYLIEEQKVIGTWDSLRIMNRDFPSRFVSIDSKGYLQLGEVQQEDVYSITTLSPGLDIVSAHDGVTQIWATKDEPQKDKDYKIVNGRRTPVNISNSRSSIIYLAPHPDVEGWYGVLETDGTVSVPDGSLALVPISQIRYFQTGSITPGQPSRIPYELTYGYMVPYPDADGNIHWGWGSPERKVFTGPIWRDWESYISEKIDENNRNTPGIMYHASPAVYALENIDGTWHSFMPFYPQTYLLPATEQAEELLVRASKASTDTGQAIASMEKQAINYTSTMTAFARKQSGINERNRVQQENERRRKEEENTREYQRILAEGRKKYIEANRRPKSTPWQGFTYTPQVTERYNKAVDDSRRRMEMRRFNQELNHRIRSR